MGNNKNKGIDDKVFKVMAWIIIPIPALIISTIFTMGDIIMNILLIPYKFVNYTKVGFKAIQGGANGNKRTSRKSR